MATLLVIRDDDRFSSTLREAGCEVVNLALIETKPLDDLSDLRERLAKLPEYDGIFFTSPVAAEIFVNERKGSNGFYGGVYALGRRARTVLANAGLNVRSAVLANTAQEMLSEIGDAEFAGKRFLFVRGEKSLRTIPQTLADIADVDEVAVYEAVPSIVSEERIGEVSYRLSNGDFDFVCLFSPSAVERFAERFGDTASNIQAAAIGTTTANAVRKAGLNVSFVSPRSDADDFARGLIDHIKNIE